MPPGLPFVFAAMAFFGVFASLYKVAHLRQCSVTGLTVAMFGSGMLLAAALAAVASGRGSWLPVWLAAAACVAGALGVTAVWSFQRALRHGRMATSWLVVNLSQSIAVTGSIVFYHERVNPAKAAALALIVLAVTLLAKDKAIHDQEATKEEAAGVG